MPTALAHDLGQVAISAPGSLPNSAPPGAASPLRDQTTGGGSPPPAAPATSPAAPAASAPTPTVDRIDIVDSPTGAIGGYPPVTTGDLNTPGPWNSATTDGVSNVHQIQFHLDRGDSGDLVPNRQLQRSAWIGGVEHRNPADLVLPGGLVVPGGFNGVLVGPDGPAAHEVRRPARDRIVVADAPGIAALPAGSYPFIYRSHFTVTVATTGGTPVARASFDVRIEKRSAADVPNTENQITSTGKEDLVRQRSLP